MEARIPQQKKGYLGWCLVLQLLLRLVNHHINRTRSLPDTDDTIVAVATSDSSSNRQRLDMILRIRHTRICYIHVLYTAGETKIIRQRNGQNG